MCLNISLSMRPDMSQYWFCMCVLKLVSLTAKQVASRESVGRLILIVVEGCNLLQGDENGKEQQHGSHALFLSLCLSYNTKDIAIFSCQTLYIFTTHLGTLWLFYMWSIFSEIALPNKNIQFTLIIVICWDE